MKGKIRSLNQIVEEHVKRWQLTQMEQQKAPSGTPVITISREPGSGGKLVAQLVAERLGLDLFHQEMIHEMASSAQASTRLLETLDEKGLSMVEDWMASLVNERHLWPNEYSRHLMNVVGTIGRHGKAVLVGRGANFILPPGQRFRVRVIAPQAMRIDNVARDFDIPAEEARRRVIRTESDRRAFIRKYFNADIANPLNYDMILNTATLSIEQAADAICGIWAR
jgi:cytidylate kinase